MSGKSLAVDYLNLTRIRLFPRGCDLIFWPSAWGLLLAANNYEAETRSLVIQHLWLAIGSTMLHAGVCVLNDILDRDFDGKVERTKNRPLVTGAIPVRNAALLCAGLVAIPVYLLSFTNSATSKWGILGLFPFHAFYPLMKRFTYWPQAWLGFAMNWGILVGYLNVSGGQWGPEIFVLFAGSVAWTISYDTMYAFQDIENDLQVGVKSTAILFGPKNARKILTGFYAVFLVTLYITGVLNGQGFYYFLISVGGAALHLTWQLVTWKQDNWDDCFSKLVSNGDLSALIWFGLFVNHCAKNSQITMGHVGGL